MKICNSVALNSLKNGEKMREITLVATGAERSPQSGSGREGFLASLKFLTWNK
jgi:hypothetical protein